MENPFYVKSQNSLTAGSLEEIYVAPAGYVVFATIYICNRGAATTFRLAIAKHSEADDPAQYIYYDTPLPANDTLEIGSITLNESDLIRAQAASANVSVNVFINDVRELAAT